MYMLNYEECTDELVVTAPQVQSEEASSSSPRTRKKYVSVFLPWLDKVNFLLDPKIGDVQNVKGKNWYD